MPFQTLPAQERSGNSFLENIISTVEASGKFVDSYLQGQEKQQKKAKDKIDAYIALRKAGYPEKDAYEAANTYDLKKLKGVPGVVDLETEEKKLKLEETKADIALKKKKLSESGKIDKKNVKVVGNALIKYDPETGETSTLYTAPASNKIMRTTGGAFFEKDGQTGKIKKIIDESGELLDTGEILPEESNDNIKTKAKQYLVSKGLKGTDQQVNTFLSKNPTFK